MAPGDELWECYRVLYADPMVSSADEIPGFELVRDREVLDWIDRSDPTGQIIEFSSGFALIRKGEILDWIGEPP
jgi:hypothetical protein